MEAADDRFCEGLKKLITARELQLCACYISEELRTKTAADYRANWDELVGQMFGQKQPAP